MKYHLTLKSSNRKTGNMPVSTSPMKTCPSSCPFKGKGCYAEGGPLRIHWGRVSCGKAGTEWKEFLGTISKLPEKTIWRHNQSGDLRGSKNRINRKALLELIVANKNKNGFTYTHYSVLNGKVAKHNRAVIREANKKGFVINLSSENLKQADKLADLNIGPITTVVASNIDKSLATPAGRKVIVCPATQNNNMTCGKCKLCAKSDRKVIIAFPSHGFRKGCVDKILKGVK